MATATTFDELYQQNLKINKDAADKQYAGLQEASEISKANNKAMYDKSSELLTQQAAAAKKQTESEYDEIYDTNAVNQYVREEQLAESMANAGLTNSGLNATQMTAIETGRGNADSRARLAEQEAINAIELQLQQDIAENEQAITSFNATADANLAQTKGQLYAQAEADAYSGAKEDWNSYKEEQKEYLTAISDAQEKADEERLNSLKSATAGVVALSEEYDAEVAMNHIVHYIKQYGMSDTEIYDMCGKAGISYNDFVKTHKKDISVARVVSNAEEINNYTDAMSTYNISQYGIEQLLPKLKSEGVLSQSDITWIKNFFTDGILPLYAVRNQINQDQTSGDLFTPSRNAFNKIMSAENNGDISANAGAYAIALLHHHGFGSYLSA